MNVGRARRRRPWGSRFTWLPGPIHLVVMILAGFVGGAVCGDHPGRPEGEDRRARGHHDDHAQLRRGAASSCTSCRRRLLRAAGRARRQARPVAAFPHLFGRASESTSASSSRSPPPSASRWLLNRTTDRVRVPGRRARTRRRARGRDEPDADDDRRDVAGRRPGRARRRRTSSRASRRAWSPASPSGLGFDGIAIALARAGASRWASSLPRSCSACCAPVGARMQVVTADARSTSSW